MAANSSESQPQVTQQRGGVGRWLPFYLALALIWGCSFLFINVGLESFTPAGVAFTRIAFGAITLIIISLATRTPILPRWSWKYVFIASMLWASIPWMLFGFGQQYVTSALAGIINGATPLMTLLAILIAFPEEKPTRQRILGLTLGFLGILMVVGVWNLVTDGERSDLVGIGALVVAIACYGLAFPFARRYLSGTGTRPAPNPIALFVRDRAGCSGDGCYSRGTAGRERVVVVVTCRAGNPGKWNRIRTQLRCGAAK